MMSLEKYNFCLNFYLKARIGWFNVSLVCKLKFAIF